MSATIIGYYKPPKWNRKMVFDALCTISAKAGLVPLPMGKHRLHKGMSSRGRHADLMRRIPKNDTADLQWHQDGDTSGAEMNCGLVVWASNTPTQVKLADGTIIQAEPYEVVHIRNRECVHRRPPNCPRVRWFFRQRVK